MLGELPPHFLRVTPNVPVPNDTDQQYALALDRQLNYAPVGRLHITVDQVGANLGVNSDLYFPLNQLNKRKYGCFLRENL